MSDDIVLDEIIVDMTRDIASVCFRLTLKKLGLGIV